jgi:beta-lactamase class A
MMSSGKWIGLILLGMLAAASITWLAMKPAMEARNTELLVKPDNDLVATHTELPCDDVSMVRDNSPSLTKPFLFADVSCESDALQSLKQDLTGFIESQKALGKIQRASVYYKELNSLHWTTAYGDELYYPGSMMKVPLLLTILKQAQRDKSLLERKIQFQSSTKLTVFVPVQNPMQVGNFYSVQELLERMILHSDNDATSLLFTVHNKDLYDELFLKLSIPVQGAEDVYYRVSPADMAKFFRVLYNASYLSSLYSEYALDLLTKSDFKQGVLQGIPSGTKVAHKFGERFTTGDLIQLHEAAIVYRGSSAFAVTIMTEGKKIEDLSAVMGAISKICFEQKKAQAPLSNSHKALHT